MNIIECRGLSKRYPRKQALNNLSFTIKEHTITGLIGKNGAGKTTLLKLMAGFHSPSSGEIKVFSDQPFNSLRVSQNTIFIDDHLTLSPSLTLLEHLQTARRFYPNWDHDLATRLLHYFSLHPSLYHHELSKGMRSTFNMIIGLAARCPLTIFDEPTTGMDTAIRRDFYRALLKEYLAFPRTIILSSHLLRELEDILEDILLIHQGGIRLHLSVEEMRQYAVGLTGNKELIDQIVAERECLHVEHIGMNSSYAVVKNDASIQEISRQYDLELSPVSAEDVCVYLTNQKKGRIDDVLNRA